MIDPAIVAAAEAIAAEARRRAIPLDRVIVFGSRACGEASATSGVDLLLVVDRPLDYWFDRPLDDWSEWQREWAERHGAHEQHPALDFEEADALLAAAAPLLPPPPLWPGPRPYLELLPVFAAEARWPPLADTSRALAIRDALIRGVVVWPAD